MLKKPPESPEEKEAAEDLRCSALGNSFHAVLVAALLCYALWSYGVKKLSGHHEMVEAWAEELKRMAVSPPPTTVEVVTDQTQAGGDPGEDSDTTQVQSFKMERKTIPRSPASATSIAGVTERDLNLAVQMVQAFVRRQEYRGSDVRLDVSTLYRPDTFPRATVNPHRWLWHEAHAYPFQREEHINVLELRALIHCVEWRLRKNGFHGTRFLHLSDSQVLSVAVKGRSSSRQLNHLLRRLGSMLVAAGLYPALAWIESHLNPADAPSRRMSSKKKVQHIPTQASRNEERRKVGPLSKLVVQPKTQTRYEGAFHLFCKFHNVSFNFSPPEPHVLDDWAAEYIEALWEDGHPKSMASYALAALQYFRPQAKNHLVWSWKLVKTWNQVELPTRATPLTPDLLLAMAGQCFKWKQQRLGRLLVLGFSAFLRTSELLNLQRKEVILPSTAGPREAVLLLATTKGTKKNFLPLDKVVLQERLALQALEQLCEGIQPGDALSQLSNHQFRRLFRDLLVELKLHEAGYMPYSLSRGGVTSAYRTGVSL